MQLNTQLLNMDAWSDGQMRSKLWLCQQLEAHWQVVDRPASLWIYGAWYGTLAQFLLIRDRIKIGAISLFDIDEAAVDISRKMTMMWWLNNKVKFDFSCVDCGDISTEKILSENPDLIINTSCEHFDDYRWFKNLPSGQFFLIQSTNMEHPTHVLKTSSLSDLKNQLGEISHIYYEGVLPFRYPNFSFERYMIIGRK